jgi:glycosyltransferase involved in cell wall biosynthesis
MNDLNMRVALQQRVMPEYRVPFFNALGNACGGDLEVFAGLPRTREAIAVGSQLDAARFVRARNLHLFSGRTYFCAQMGILRWLETYQPQVLIVEANPRYLSTPGAIHWMHNRHRPVLGWGLGAPRSGRAESALRRQFLSSLDGMIVYSQTGAEQVVAAGFPAERVFVAPNAVAARPQRPPAKRPAAFANGQPSLLFVGRLQERKRLEMLLKACAQLPITIQPQVVIVGDGPDRARLEALASQVYPRAQFAGARHGVELEPYFAVADLFVLPGTGGLAVQQAMAHGLPVLVGEADGTQSELVRPENGWLLASPTEASLAATLAEALSDPLRLRRMGEASFHIVDEQVNLEAMVQAFLTAIVAVTQR